MRVYTVSQLTRELKNIIEESFPPVWVEGEVTDFRPAHSGHLYFSLKDEYALLHCIVFEGERTFATMSLENGAKVRLYGELNLWEKGGKYSLIVHRVYPVGIGDLSARFEQLKQKLKAEGLFDPVHKKRIPEFPECIGVVTATAGAAIKDIVNVTRRRSPSTEIVVRSAKVQGDGAAHDIAAGIDELCEYGKCDVIIIGRGGGSQEDLWAFNEEVVARAIYKASIPIVSAVGHEIDYTIADFVADLRAPTPSAAAELVLKNRRELLDNIIARENQIKRSFTNKISELSNRLDSFEKGYGFRKPLDIIYQKFQTLDELDHRLNSSLAYLLELKRERFNFITSRTLQVIKQNLENIKNRATFLETRLTDVSPIATLKRGYSICFKLPNQTIVRRSKELLPADNVRIKFYEGEAKCEVLERN
jgi:exodeoxyribonuclease VII large subunit